MDTIRRIGSTTISRYGLEILALGFALTLFGLLGHESWQARRDVLREAERSAINLTRVLAEHTAQTMRGIDNLLDKIIEDLAPAEMFRAGPSNDVEKLLRDELVGRPDINALRVIDRDGRIVADTNNLLLPPSLAEREYFRVHRDDPGAGLHIGRPVLDLRANKWFVPMIRRLTDASGNFAGIVVAAVEPAYFQGLYQAIDLGPGGVVTLFLRDGTILVGEPADAATIGTSLAETKLFQTYLPAASAGSFTGKGAFGGSERIFSYQAVAEGRLVVATAVTLDHILEDWYENAMASLAISLVAAVVLLLMVRLRVQHRRLEAANALVRASDERFRHLAANVPGMLYVCKRGPDGRVRYTYISPRVRDLCGFEPEEVIANPNLALDVIHPEDREAFHEAARSSAAVLDPWSMEFRLVTRNGEVKWVQGLSQAHGGPQGEVTWDGVLIDISARKAAETALAAAKQEAELANRGKSEFLAAMSHELRTPLNAIIGFAEMMQLQTLGRLNNPRYREYARHIHDSGHHLLGLINDVLDLSKIEAGRLELSEEWIDLADVARGGLTMVQGRAAAGAVGLSTDLPADLPLVWADKRAVKQVLLNLLSNAVKFTPSGGSVRLSVLRDGNDVVIKVADTGLGIAEAARERILQPFGQANSMISRKFGGTGLGLPISKRLIELHGGTLIIESELGLGTEIMMRFPAIRVGVAADRRAAG